MIHYKKDMIVDTGQFGQGTITEVLDDQHVLVNVYLAPYDQYTDVKVHIDTIMIPVKNTVFYAKEKDIDPIFRKKPIYKAYPHLDIRIEKEYGDGCTIYKSIRFYNQEIVPVAPIDILSVMNNEDEHYNITITGKIALHLYMELPQYDGEHPQYDGCTSVILLDYMAYKNDYYPLLAYIHKSLSTGILEQPQQPSIYTRLDTHGYQKDKDNHELCNVLWHREDGEALVLPMNIQDIMLYVNHAHFYEKNIQLQKKVAPIKPVESERNPFSMIQTPVTKNESRIRP